MRASFLVPCEYVIRGSNGAPSLLGIFHAIGTREFPHSIAGSFVAFELEAEPFEADREYDLVMRLIDADGHAILEYSGIAEFLRHPESLPSQFWYAYQLDERAQLPAPGVYRFDLLLDNDIIASTRMVARFVSEADEAI